MKSNPPILLLDTNVWLDVYIPGRPGSTATCELLFEAQTQDVPLAYPAHVALDVYQKVRLEGKKWIRKSHELTQTETIAIKRMAWDYINEMRKIATAVPIDFNDIALACHFRDEHDDFEDTLVMAACQRAKANYLVTRDVTLAAHSPIEAKTPKEMTELLRTGRAKGTPNTGDRSSTEWLYEFLSKYGQEEED